MQITRRRFLQQVAAGAIAAPLMGRELAAQAQIQIAAPTDIVRHATFGCGGMAWGDVQQFALHPAIKVVAACDVDASRTVEFRKKFPDARLYSDYRELLDKEKELHSVNVSTPDHMHAPIAMTAMQRGLHVYGQKPLAHNLYEVRRMTEFARENKLVTQMGIQIHSNACYRSAVATIQKGAIGKIKEVHTWSNKKWGDNGAIPDRIDPVPAGLDWYKWIGVAAARPFIEGFYHPGEWRKRLDFGTGTFGDMGCHIYDPVFNALALTSPTSVRSEGAAPNAHSWATDAVIHYTFPGTAFTEGETVKVTWYDGDQRPPIEVQAQARPQGAALDDPRYRMNDQGSIFIGTAGVMVLPHVSMPRLYGKDITNDAVQKLDDLDHYNQFVDAVLGKGTTTAHFGYSGPLTEAVLLGSVASRFPQTTLQWDAAAMKFPGTPEADQYVRENYRQGWDVPGL